MVVLWQLVDWGKGRVADLGNVHLHEHLGGELLQPANVDGALLRSLQIARPLGESERVFMERMRAIQYLFDSQSVVSKTPYYGSPAHYVKTQPKANPVTMLIRENL